MRKRRRNKRGFQKEQGRSGRSRNRELGSLAFVLTTAAIRDLLSKNSRIKSFIMGIIKPKQVAGADEKKEIRNAEYKLIEGEENEK